MAGRDTAFLNVFRGFAALWVVVAHCQMWGGAVLIPLPSPKQAVDLFMVLSGFLMVLTVDAKRRSWLGFWVRRFFRIAPAYYLSLVAVALVWSANINGAAAFRALNPVYWAGDTTYDPHRLVLSLRMLLWHVSFLFGFHPDHSFSSSLPDWSLSLEMQFYAAFPIVYLLLKSRSLWWMFAVATACVAFGIGYRVGVTEFGWSPFHEPSFLLFKLPVFIAGMLIYEAGRAETRIAALLLACALLLIEYRWAGPTAFFLWVLVGSLIGIWVGRRESWVDRASHWPIVTFASDCSYSVYLFHGLVLTTMGAPLLMYLLRAGWHRTTAVAALTTFVLVAVYPLSYAIYRLVEQPGIRMGSRVENALARRGAKPSP